MHGNTETRQNQDSSNASHPARFPIAVNRRFVGKVKAGDPRFRELNMTFATEVLTARELLDAVRAGHAWTAPHRQIQHEQGKGKLSTYRLKENVIHVTALGVDVDTEDDHATLASWRADAFFSEFGAFAYTTASHKPDAPRSRAVFVLSEPVDVTTAEAGIAALLERYPFADQKASDASRLFYGAPKCECVFLDNVLPVDVLRAEIDARQQRLDDGRREREAQRAARAKKTTGAAGPVASYIRSTTTRILDDVAGAPEGTRHDALLRASVRLGSLSSADWLDDAARDILADAEDDLKTAAATWCNGRGDEDEVARIISGTRNAPGAFAYGQQRPAWEPDWQRMPACQKTVNTALDDVPLDTAQDFFAAAGPQTDARGRDIYAGLVGSPALVVTVPAGAYLADVLSEDDLPARCLLSANTGIGKTTFAENLSGQTLIVTSSTVALEQICERRRAAGQPVDAYYHNEKTANADSRLIVTTYESFAHVLRLVDASRFALVVDEVHNFAASSARGFRGPALESVVDTLGVGAWRRVLLMTGTPMPSSHPALRQFSRVNVVSQLRGQRAQRVVYKQTDASGKTTGRKLEALLALCDLRRSHLIFLNDKGSKLDKVYAGLIAKGFAPDEVAILNADTKKDAAGRAVIETEKIPAGVRVLIVTAVLVESANLRDAFDAVHIFSDIHPYLAQQLVNRLRSAAAGVVYWYNSGSGAARSASIASHHAHYLREAQSLVAHLNHFASVDPNDDSDEARLKRRSMRLWAGKVSELVRVDEDEETRRKWWTISYLGVDHMTFDAVAELARGNPDLFKNTLAPFGWEWDDDLELVVTGAGAGQQDVRDRVAGELRQAREDAQQQRVETIREHGEEWVKTAQHNATTDAQTLRAADTVLRLKRALLDDTPKPTTVDDRAAWTLACNLARDAGDSRRKVNTAARRLKIVHLRGRCAFTDAFYRAFRVGERLTAEDVHQRVLAIFAADPLMAEYAATRYLYHFSQQATPRISQARAVELVADMFSLKRTSQRDAAGAVVHVYELVDDMPLGEVVATFAKKIRQTSVYVATNDALPAFASPAHAMPDDVETSAPVDVQTGADSLLDWFLATENAPRRWAVAI